MKTLAANSLGFLRALGRRGIAWALLLLLAGLVATVELTRREQHRAAAAAAHAFAEDCQEIQDKIATRLAAHEQILRSAAAYFAGSRTVTRAEWRVYYERQSVHQPLPGSTGIGFAAVVPPARLAAHLQAIRGEGFPDYRLWPEGARETYTSIIFLEPFVGRNLRAFGFDMFSEPTRRAAMERARDEDVVALSAKVRLMQETEVDPQAGTLLYVPIYRRETPPETVEQRRASLVGWVFSPFRMNDLLDAAIQRGASPTLPRVRVELFDGTAPDPAALLFDSQRSDARAPATAHARTLTTAMALFGRTWLLRFTATAASAVTADSGDAWKIFCTGSLISFLVAGLALSLANTRHNSRMMAERLTKDLRESEERHRTLVDSSPEAVTVHRRGIIIYVNPAAIRFAGAASAADLLGQPLIERVHPDFRPLVAARVKEMTEKHTSVPTVEMKFLKLDGTPFDVEVQATAIIYDGEPAIRVVARDITDYKIATAALRASEESYRLLFDGMLDGFALHEIICDAAGRPVDYRFLSVNPAFERLTGLRGADLVGRTVLAVMPTTEPVWIERYGRVVLTGEGIEFEEFSAVLDKHFEISAFRPRPGQFATVFIDITVSKRAEAALRESEERFRVLFEGAPDAMLLADPATGRVIDANEAAGRLLGRPRTALVGLHQTELHPPQRHDFSQASFHDHVVKAESIGHTDPVETSVLRPDGTEIPVEILAQAIRLHGQPTVIGTFRDITVRKQAEIALKRSEERYRSILNASPDDITITDLTGRILLVSPAALPMFGLASQTDATRRPVTDFISPDDHALVATKLAAMFEGTNPGPTELRARRSDGHIFPIEATAEFIRDETGQPTGIVFVVRDITARKRSEDTLRASEEQFRSYIEHAPMGVFLADEAGYYVGVNQAAARTTGYSVAELLSLRVPDLWAPGADAIGAAHFQSLMATGRASGEVAFRRKDGSVGYWLVDAVRLSPDRVLAFTVETTARKESEQKLAESRDLLANLARLVPGVVYQYRLYPDGRSAFPFASPGMHEIYEVSPAEVREDATPVFGRLHPDDAARVGETIMESARTLGEFYCEYRVVLPHQGLRWRWSQAHPERTPDGGTLWHGIISDVTDRKEAELALQTSLHEKEALLKEVHHRVKNNLQVIMSLLRMEGRRSTQADTKFVLSEMQGRIRSMALLHESLYRSGTFAAVDLAGYLRQLATQAFRSFQATPNKVRLDLALDPVLVEMDQALPCGLLVNELISNALKHAFPDGRAGLVRVALQPVAGEPARWCLAVTDDGVGLPPDFDARRSQSLGLQLVADLAGQLRGTLALTPAAPAGTCVAITFALVAPPPAASP